MDGQTETTLLLGVKFAVAGKPKPCDAEAPVSDKLPPVGGVQRPVCKAARASPMSVTHDVEAMKAVGGRTEATVDGRTETTCA